MGKGDRRSVPTSSNVKVGAIRGKQRKGIADRQAELSDSAGGDVPSSLLRACRRVVSDAVGRTLLGREIALQRRAGDPNQILVVQMPQPRRFIATGGEYLLAIRRKRYTKQCTHVSAQDVQLLACGYVSQARGSVEAAGEHLLTIRRESHPADPAGLAAEDAQFLTSLGVPQPRGVVASIPTGQHFLVVW